MFTECEYGRSHQNGRSDMTKQAQDALNQIARRSRIRAARATEFKAAEAAATTAVEKFWAGSCLASVLRDYQAGRVVTVEAK
jgi:hypothetical protein